MNITPTEALHTLAESGKLFTEVFSHGSLMVEIYKPVEQDLQTPHDRDEIYVIISGTGIFFVDGERFPFKQGDFLFVPALMEHRFESFTTDFATWVFFYGPVGGEKMEDSPGS
jgi:mannose-6-phosphate isomerase-like protein (cupin superfamily)